DLRGDDRDERSPLRAAGSARHRPSALARRARGASGCARRGAGARGCAASRRMTMRIGIGALLGIVGGPATYAAELVRALARLGGHEYVVFTDRPDAFAGVGVETVHVPLPSTYHQVIWDHTRLPGLLRRHGVALYHGTKGIRPLRCPVPAIVTVHDLAVYVYPETFAWPQRWHFRLCVPPSVASAACVIADSEHARGDLVARLGVASERVRVVPLGVAERFRVGPPVEAVDRLRRRFDLGETIIACV